jgi:hypothetical protein
MSIGMLSAWYGIGGLMNMPWFPGDTDGVERVELQYHRMKSALMTLNAMFEAARVGNAGMPFSVSVSEFEDLSEATGNAPGKD